MEVHSQVHASATLSLPPPWEGPLGFKMLDRLKYTWLELLVHCPTAWSCRLLLE